MINKATTISSGTPNVQDSHARRGMAADARFLEGNQVPSDPFFVQVPYKGAFADQDNRWYGGWTVNIPAR